ncbi:MAG: hypothetical protein KF767_03100 [Bdellovibrionaceae bacterium]|nr:hypothetical protein [Pseudobdellovibrionaceae bacterium]
MPDEIKGIVTLHPEGLNDTGVAKTLADHGLSKKSFYHRVAQGRAKSDVLSRGAVEKMFREDDYRGTLNFYMKYTDQVGNPRYASIPKEKKEKISVSVPRILSDDVWA